MVTELGLGAMPGDPSSFLFCLYSVWSEQSSLSFLCHFHVVVFETPCLLSSTVYPFRQSYESVTCSALDCRCVNIPSYDITKLSRCGCVWSSTEGDAIKVLK